MRYFLTILFGLGLFAAPVAADDAGMPAAVSTYIEAVAAQNATFADQATAEAEMAEAEKGQGVIAAYRDNVALRDIMAAAGLDTTEIDDRIAKNQAAYDTAVARLTAAEEAIEPVAEALNDATDDMFDARDAAMVYLASNGFGQTLDALVAANIAASETITGLEAQLDAALADAADRNALADALVDHCGRNPDNKVCNNPAVAAALAAADEVADGTN